MSDTKVARLSDVPAVRGLPKDVRDPIKPELFAGKVQRNLAKWLGLEQFGVNHVCLEPGAVSALRHWHEGEDELVYVLVGRPTLVDESGEHPLEPSAFAAFPAGAPNAHHIVNRSDDLVELLVIGSRRPGQDVVHYPDDPLGPFRK